jgi:DNA-binding transcriptional LysR family regulator
MELRHLLYFEAVARHHSVTRAAEELSVAQPAITKQLHDLEKELEGGPLYQRVGRNLRLTEAGKCLLDHTRAILSQVEALKIEVREHGELKQGRVTIGAPPTVGEHLLPDLLADFHRRYPEVELHMHEANSQTLLELMDRAEIDLAIITQPTDQSRLRITPLFKEELVLIVGLGHPLATRTTVEFGELAHEAFLLFSPGHVRDLTLEACRQAGFNPRIVLNGGSVEMLLRMARTGLGIAVFPELAVRERGKMAVLKITNPPLWRIMVLASREDRALTPAVVALRNFLEKNLAQ